MTDITLSTTAYLLPGVPPDYLTKPTLGTSKQYEMVEQKTLEAFGQSIFPNFTSVLASNLVEYCMPNWDGEGAKPVSYNALLNCAAFLTKIAGNIPLPEIQVDPDGWISLEWYTDQSNLLEISFGPSDSGTYSALIDGKGHCGEVDVLGRGISRLLSAIFEDLNDISTTASHTG